MYEGNHIGRYRKLVDIQDLGATLGQYGYNEISEPEILPFDEHAEENIRMISGIP